MNLTKAWPIERTDEARALWAKGLSRSQIASELGVTRNSVIGKLYRLNVSGRPKGLPKPKQKRRRAAPRMKQPRPLDLVLAETEQIDLPSDQSPDACSILELTPETCRWPMGDPGNRDFRYCGAQRHFPFVYCKRHAAIAFKPGGRRY